MNALWENMLNSLCSEDEKGVKLKVDLITPASNQKPGETAFGFTRHQY